VKKDRLARGEEADRARLDPGSVRRLERKNAELRMEHDVLTRNSARRGACSGSRGWCDGDGESEGFDLAGESSGVLAGAEPGRTSRRRGRCR
jgi:hypothetical protein